MYGTANARVVVTGGASNIGRGIVHQFAAEGARIVISDIDEPQAEKVRAEALERGAVAVELAIADLTTPDGADTAIGRAVTAWGGIDVLVNNAGWSVPGFIATDTDRDKWQRTIEINLFTAIAATQSAIGPMKDGGGGSIVFIASDAAFGQIRRASRRIEGSDGRVGSHHRARAWPSRDPVERHLPRTGDTRWPRCRW